MQPSQLLVIICDRIELKARVQLMKVCNRIYIDVFRDSVNDFSQSQISSPKVHFDPPLILHLKTTSKISVQISAFPAKIALMPPDIDAS